MNLHPLVVHFPIALLICYVGIECFQVFWYRDNEHVKRIKRFCLIVGTLGAMASLQTGEAAEHKYGRSALIETHSTWATATTAVFQVLAALTIASVQTWTQRYTRDTRIRSVITPIITSKWIVIIAIIGMVGLTVVGGLGGAIVRGASADAFSQWLVQTLVP